MQIPRALGDAGNGSSAASPRREGGTVGLTSSGRTKDKKARTCRTQQLEQKGREAFWGLGSPRCRTALATVSGGRRQTTAWRQFGQKWQSAHLSWLKSSFLGGGSVEANQMSALTLVQHLRTRNKPRSVHRSSPGVFNRMQARAAVAAASHPGAERRRCPSRLQGLRLLKPQPANMPKSPGPGRKAPGTK